MTPANACPVISLDTAAATPKAIEVVDDFGGRVQMSREQFGVLVKEAKEGKFDSAIQA